MWLAGNVMAAHYHREHGNMKYVPPLPTGEYRGEYSFGYRRERYGGMVNRSGYCVRSFSSSAAEAKPSGGRPEAN